MTPQKPLNISEPDWRRIVSNQGQRILARCRRFGTGAVPSGNGNLATVLTLVRCGLLDGDGTTTAGEAVLFLE
jgi:hypothetical protein